MDAESIYKDYQDKILHFVKFFGFKLKGLVRVVKDAYDRMIISYEQVSSLDHDKFFHTS